MLSHNPGQVLVLEEGHPHMVASDVYTTEQFGSVKFMDWRVEDNITPSYGMMVVEHFRRSTTCSSQPIHHFRCGPIKVIVLENIES